MVGTLDVSERKSVVVLGYRDTPAAQLEVHAAQRRHHLGGQERLALFRLHPQRLE